MKVLLWLNSFILCWISLAAMPERVRPALILVNENKTYSAAKRICRETFNGSLLQSYEHSREAMTCLPNTKVWSQPPMTPWINIMGCFEYKREEDRIESSLSNMNFSWMDDVARCQSHCSSKRSRYFAIKGESCVCEPYLRSFKKLPSKYCIHRYRGSDHYYTVYETVDLESKSRDPGEKCIKFQCYQGNPLYLAAKCSGKHMQMLCENQAVVNGTYKTGLSKCWKMSQFPQKYKNGTCKGGTYFIGTFRRRLLSSEGHTICQTFENSRIREDQVKCTEEFPFICNGTYKNGNLTLRHKVCKYLAIDSSDTLTTPKNPIQLSTKTTFTTTTDGVLTKLSSTKDTYPITTTTPAGITISKDVSFNTTDHSFVDKGTTPHNFIKRDQNIETPDNESNGPSTPSIILFGLSALLVVVVIIGFSIRHIRTRRRSLQARRSEIPPPENVGIDQRNMYDVPGEHNQPVASHYEELEKLENAEVSNKHVRNDYDELGEMDKPHVYEKIKTEKKSRAKKKI